MEHMHILWILNCFLVGFTVNKPFSSWTVRLVGIIAIVYATKESMYPNQDFLRCCEKQFYQLYFTEKTFPEKQLERKWGSLVGSQLKENKVSEWEIGTEEQLFVDTIYRWVYSHSKSLCLYCSLNCVKYCYINSLSFYISVFFPCLNWLAFDKSQITVYILASSNKNAPFEPQLYWLLLWVIKGNSWLLDSKMWLVSNPISLGCLHQENLVKGHRWR